MYPNPEEFNPDRYLNPKYPTYKEPLTKYPNVINHHVFGYGRRNCLGMEIVDYQLVTIMGSLAWAFDVTKKKNKIGIGTYRALWHIRFVLTKCRHPCTHIRVDRLAHHSTGGFCVRHQAKE